MHPAEPGPKTPSRSESMDDKINHILEYVLVPAEGHRYTYSDGSELSKEDAAKLLSGCVDMHQEV